MSNPDPYPYKVMNDDGDYVMQATEDCRYDPEIEALLLKSHHRIFLFGNEITMKDIENQLQPV